MCFGTTANRNFLNLSLAITLNLFYEYRLFDDKNICSFLMVVFSNSFLWNRLFSAIISSKKKRTHEEEPNWCKHLNDETRKEIAQKETNYDINVQIYDHG